MRASEPHRNDAKPDTAKPHYLIEKHVASPAHGRHANERAPDITRAKIIDFPFHLFAVYLHHNLRKLIQSMF